VKMPRFEKSSIKLAKIQWFLGRPLL